jgi:hypothetical protein
MTNTRLPQSARRAIVELANREYERLQDFCFQIAMDTAADADLVIPDFDDEDSVESILREYALEIQNNIISRMKLTGMFEAMQNEGN